MGHKETKKETKRQDNKSKKPEIIHEDEVKKHYPDGAIKASSNERGEI